MARPMTPSEAGRLGGRPKGFRLSQESKDRISKSRRATEAEKLRLAEIGRAVEAQQEKESS